MRKESVNRKKFPPSRESFQFGDDFHVFYGVYLSFHKNTCVSIGKTRTFSIHWIFLFCLPEFTFMHITFLENGTCTNTQIPTGRDRTFSKVLAIKISISI